MEPRRMSPMQPKAVAKNFFQNHQQHGMCSRSRSRSRSRTRSTPKVFQGKIQKQIQKQEHIQPSGLLSRPSLEAPLGITADRDALSPTQSQCMVPVNPDAPIHHTTWTGHPEPKATVVHIDFFQDNLEFSAKLTPFKTIGHKAQYCLLLRPFVEIRTISSEIASFQDRQFICSTKLTSFKTIALDDTAFDSPWEKPFILTPFKTIHIQCIFGLLSRPFEDFMSYSVKLTSFKTIQRGKRTIVHQSVHFKTIVSYG